VSPGRLVRDAALGVALIAAAAACRAPSDAERAGDRAYVAGGYAEALAQYDAALQRGSDGRLWAKEAAAAMHAGKLKQAVDGYLRLAGEDPSRADEAADGLETIARGADRAGDAVTLQAAMAGLRAIAPDRGIGRYVLTLVRLRALSDADLLPLLPDAMAAAPDEGTMDSLLQVYADLLRKQGGCDQAVLAYRAALRRGLGPAGRSAAAHGLADCALRLGSAELADGNAGSAIGWYAEGVQYDSASETGRRALLGIGQAHLAQGDTVGAALAFQAAVAHSEQDDSIRHAAAARLRALGATPTAGDSARTGTP
jgi:tetratricopeptide (TPR) repeat protein